MSDLDVVRHAAEVFEAASPRVRESTPSRRGKRKTLYRIEWAGQRAEYLMQRVLPYMGERRSAKINELLAMENLSHRPRAKREETT